VRFVGRQVELALIEDVELGLQQHHLLLEVDENLRLLTVHYFNIKLIKRALTLNCVEDFGVGGIYL
jgi:hypothetical protein